MDLIDELDNMDEVLEIEAFKKPRRIRIGFYVHEWTYGGTARSHERLCLGLFSLGLFRYPAFEVFAIYWPQGDNPRLPRLAPDHLIPFERTLERLGPETGYRPMATNFHEVVANLKLDILHHARGGYFEWPFNMRHAKIQVETNIFGEYFIDGNLDHSVSISKYVRALIKNQSHIYEDQPIYNPIPRPTLAATMRREFGIPPDAIVCGRIGRPTNFDPIAIEAFKRVGVPAGAWFICVAPCEEFRRAAAGVPNVVLIDPTVDDRRIESFYRTIDIFCHYRSDGETHGVAIAQAMMYAKPVITHSTPHMNGQKETIADGGFFCNGVDNYTECLDLLIGNSMLRREIGNNGIRHANLFFDEFKMVEKWATKYKEWILNAS